MEKKIDIAELLKDCPKGMELDCTMYEGAELDCVTNDKGYPIKIIIKDNIAGDIAISLTKEGCYNMLHNPKCVIFPKGKTTWEGFVPPCKFKDGDIVISTNGLWIGITTGGESGHFIPTYCTVRINGESGVYFDGKEKWMFNRFATEEEKEKLFNALKNNGYRWNAGTKTLEKLIIPKFKIGDIITNGKTFIAIGYIDDEYYYEINRDIAHRLCIKNQDEWELVPNKFNVNTLKTFDQVLVRLTNNCVWMPKLFSHYDPKVKYYPFVTIENLGYPQCIPYNGNEHLRRTTNNCDEFYRVWEE